MASPAAGHSPSGRAATKTMVVADNPTPRLKDIRLPPMVMKLIPTATQPTKDMVVRKERMAGADRNPGVVTAKRTRQPMAAMRIAVAMRSAATGSRRDKRRVLMRPPDA